MGIIVPSILTPSRDDLEKKLARIQGLVDTVQIDIVDGAFASPATWPYTPPADDARELADADGLSRFGRFRYEVDLMVTNPEEVIGGWITAGASRVVIHVASARSLPTLIDDLAHKYGHDKDFAPDLLSVGLAVQIDSDLAVLDPYIDRVDYIQFMGIARIGRQGEPFDRRVLQKIQTFRSKYPKMTIQVDGGVSLVTAPDLLSAGVDRLIVGSDLWEETDIPAELARFQDLIERYGVYR